MNIPPPPSFVGNNYFCDTAHVAMCPFTSWFREDPLWDGEGCTGIGTCCSFNNSPWFSTSGGEPRRIVDHHSPTKHSSVTDDIEVRICYHHDDGDNTAIILLDLYVK